MPHRLQLHRSYFDSNSQRKQLNFIGILQLQEPRLICFIALIKRYSCFQLVHNSKSMHPTLTVVIRLHRLDVLPHRLPQRHQVLIGRRELSRIDQSWTSSWSPWVFRISFAENVSMTHGILEYFIFFYRQS